MPQHLRIQSRVNHTDNCSTGNKEAGLVNSFSFPRIPRRILKSKTATGLREVTAANRLEFCCGNQAQS